MTIFVYDKDPAENAAAHRRQGEAFARRLLQHYARVLFTAARRRGHDHDGPASLPPTVAPEDVRWAAEHIINWCWLYNVAWRLAEDLSETGEEPDARSTMTLLPHHLRLSARHYINNRPQGWPSEQR